MARHRRVGRPTGTTKDKQIVGCSKVHVYRMVKGKVVKTTGYKHKACIN